MQKIFARIATKCAETMGSAWAFILATIMVLVWAISGPAFGFSDTWELVINTATTIITFLMVFLIQNTQNRDSRALHLKLDELIVATLKANDDLIDIENLSIEELRALGRKYKQIKAQVDKLHKDAPLASVGLANSHE